MKGCDGAYFMTDFQDPAGIEGEVLQGKTFVDVAKTAGVPHIVLSSGAGTVEATKVQQFRTNFLVEEYVHGADISHTIVWPTGLMDVIPPEGFGRSMFLSALPALVNNAPLGYVACEDIGKVAGKSLLNLTQKGERIYTICGEVSTPKQLKAQLNSADIMKTRTIWLPAFLVKLFVLRLCMEMFDFLAEGRQPGSVEETKAIIPDVQGVAQRAIKQH
ncbi:hypothetical protein B9Z65_277 [Elsinoe australis]|uniref:NmrA-like domain-containing protein n=1 Tax=Elsinoe australis TaxID=40998 RepID=A0A2P7ZQ68_9PEZI|nr:hypothetical protein B9Z65_277 [Elsinoe australis]